MKLNFLLKKTPLSGSRPLAVMFTTVFLFSFGMNLLNVQNARAFGRKRDKEELVCLNLILSHPLEQELGDNEKKLACGQFPGDKNIVQAWEDIPDNQRRYHITTFLQNRGYLKPIYSIRGDKLYVDPGPLVHVTSVDIEGGPPEFNYERRRGLIGAVLSPDFLDGLKKWTEERLGAMGYACNKADPRGDPDTGIVRVKIVAGPQVIFGDVIEHDIPDIKPGVLRRYDAFRKGDPYNSDFVRLTEKRATNDGQVEGLHFRPEKCENGEATLDQEATVGKPRLLSIGVGASTEGVILGRVSWRNTRLGDTGSLIDVTGVASSIHQLLSSYAEWFFLKDSSHVFLRPSITLEHINLDPFATDTATLDFSPAMTWESQDVGYYAKVGPTLDYVKTIRGLTGTPDSHFLPLEVSARAATHYFDFYSSSPRTGYMASVVTDLNSASIYSTERASRVKFNFEGLLNLREYDPPFLVFGFRAAVASTFVDPRVDPQGTNLPPTFLQFLGGSLNLRGWGLQELPHSGIGTLSAAFASAEVRYAAGFGFGLQPFVFTDVGALGTVSSQLNSPVFYSPGFGIRWESIIGVVRASLAHGYAPGSNDPTLSHFQFYLSLGEEF